MGNLGGGVSDRWDFYRLRVDDRPASIFLDMGIAEEAPLSAYPLRACLRVSMLHPRPDGLSSQEEFDALTALEDHATPFVEAKGNAIYVGRNTSSGYRDLYFYARDLTTFEAAASAAMLAHPAYSYETDTKPDPAWRGYFDFLYPSPLSLQQMANRALQEVLAKQGDDLNQPRSIDHLVVSGEAANLEALALLLRADGFMTDGVAHHDGGLYALKFQRVDEPISMQEIATDLYEMALRYGCDYDGWGCEAVGVAPQESARGGRLGKWFKGLLG